MPGIPFIRDFKFDYGTAMEVTPLIRRVVELEVLDERNTGHERS